MSYIMCGLELGYCGTAGRRIVLRTTEAENTWVRLFVQYGNALSKKKEKHIVSLHRIMLIY